MHGSKILTQNFQSDSNIELFRLHLVKKCRVMGKALVHFAIMFGLGSELYDACDNLPTGVFSGCYFSSIGLTRLFVLQPAKNRTWEGFTCKNYGFVNSARSNLILGFEFHYYRVLRFELCIKFYWSIYRCSISFSYCIDTQVNHIMYSVFLCKIYGRKRLYFTLSNRKSQKNFKCLVMEYINVDPNLNLTYIFSKFWLELGNFGIHYNV